MGKSNLYERRGVSADKGDVHKAIENLDKGLYPTAFCKILPDWVGGMDSHCNIMHADTAGTKTSLAYLYWKETGDVSVWRGIAQDAIVMNIDDMACVGCISPIMLSSTIGRNKNRIPGEVLKELIEGTSAFVDRMSDFGIDIQQTGGETADVGDIVRTIDVGYTTFARLKKQDLVINDIKEGQYIVGLASYGQSSYEEMYNSGIGSNGLTSARHDLLHKDYAEKYPESFDPEMDDDVRYTGEYHLTDEVEINDEKHQLGKLILSPTRTYLPVIKEILKHTSKYIEGIIHCTGGGQTKVLKYMRNARVVKDNLLEIPPFFQLIKDSTGADIKEMYKVFNMGHRLELYVSEEAKAKEIVEIARSFDIDAQIIGKVEESDKKEVLIQADEEEYSYTA